MRKLRRGASGLWCEIEKMARERAIQATELVLNQVYHKNMFKSKVLKPLSLEYPNIYIDNTGNFILFFKFTKKKPMTLPLFFPNQTTWMTVQFNKDTLYIV